MWRLVDSTIARNAFERNFNAFQDLIAQIRRHAAIVQ